MISERENDKIYDVVVVGSIVVDLVTYVSRMPGRGETLIGSDFKQGFGGKGCNQAVMSKLLGSQTVIAGCVGDDTFGLNYKRHLEQEGVEMILKPAPADVSTGIALITVTEDGQNHIVVVFGANNELTAEDVIAEGSPMHQAVISARVVVCQFEMPMEVVQATLELGRRNGAFVILNPAPMPNDINCIPESAFRLAHTVCPNEIEAGILLGEAGVGLNVIDAANACLKMLKERGCSLPMVTMGGEGVLVCGNDGDTHRVPAHSVKVKDSTGAGDCFVGSLAHFLAQKLKKGQSASETENLLWAVRHAVHLASVSVTRAGTQASYPRGEELKAILKEIEC